MLLKLAESIKVLDNLLYPQKGKVIENNDPDQMGKVQCTIKGMIEETNKNKLPWIYPQSPYGLGGKPDCSSFSVPEIGSELTIIFPYKDIYFPRYIGYWQSDLTSQQILFGEDYPDTYGWVDSVIEWFKIDKKAPFIEFYRDTNQEMAQFDSEGNFWLNIPKSFYLNIGEDFRTNIGNVQSTKAGSDVVLECMNHFIKASGNKCSKVGGSSDHDIGGGHGIKAGSMITHQAAAIEHNSGILLGVIPGDLSGVHDTEIQNLDSKISEMENKINELKEIASQLKSKADSNLPNIAKV